MRRKNTRQKSVVRRNPTIIATTPPREPAAITMPKWVFKFILALIVVGGLVYFFFISPYFQVKRIETDGFLSTQGNDFLQNYKGKNIFLVNQLALEEDMREVYPEALIVKVYRGLPDTLRVTVSEREVALVWVSKDRQYLVDGTGIAYEEINEANRQSVDKLSKITDLHAMNVELGRKVATARLINFIKAFEPVFEEKTKIKITGWEIGETSIHATALTEKGWKVIINTSRSADQQVTDLEAILKKHSGDVKEYIDLRVPGYAYYK